MSYCLLEGDVDQLCCVVRSGVVSDLHTLLDTGVDINAADHQNGETALHTAVHREHDAMVQEILGRGANPDVQNKNGQTPLHLAACNGYDNGVQMLMEAEADMSLVTQFSEMTALHLASKNGHAWIVEYLLDKDADVTALDLINKPAEFYAATQEIKRLFQQYCGSSTGEIIPDVQAGHIISDVKSRELIPDVQDNSSETEEEENDLPTSDKRRKSSDMTAKDKIKSPANYKMEFSEKHKKRMRLSVFDRLTRSKTKLEKL